MRPFSKRAQVLDCLRFHWLACYALLFLVGCDSGLPQVIPCEGTVTFEGGPCPKPGTLYFTPIEPAPGYPMRPATGHFDVDGQFTATTFEPGDGLIPGRYKVGIECWEVEPNMEGRPAVSHVPATYQNPETSGFEVNVTPEGGQQEFKFDVPRLSK
ncbi:MAG: hypothetical protein HY000_23525 [Planctomycetes bacterium]|nr:hypothetical protein [Planctomycetota bacterium]